MNFFKRIGTGIKKCLSAVGRFFKRLFSPIYRYFCRRYAGLKTLVMMQLKDKLNFSFKADKKGALTKLILLGIMFIGIIAVIVVIFKIAGMLTIFGTNQDIPISVFNLFFILMTLLSTISCVIQLTNSLFFSKDNLVLLSYPVRSNVIFLSKLVVFYIIELIKEVTFVVPMFIAYGIAFGFSTGYFLWVIFMFFVIAAIPVAIASLLSIPCMFVKMFLTKRPFLQDMFFLFLMIGLTVVAFIIINMIPENLHFLTKWGSTYKPMFIDFANKVEVWFYPLYFVSALVMGANQKMDTPLFIKGVFTAQTPIILVCVLAGITLLFLISYLVARPLFFKIAVKPFEYNKKIIFHNFARARNTIKSQSYGDAFVPIFDHEISNKELVDLRSRFEKALNELVRLGGIFFGGKVDNKRIVKLLQNQTGFKFEIVNVEHLMNNCKIGYFIDFRNNVPFLVLAKKVGISYVDCYDPNYLKNQNYTKTAFFSSMWKDVLIQLLERQDGK